MADDLDGYDPVYDRLDASFDREADEPPEPDEPCCVGKNCPWGVAPLRMRRRMAREWNQARRRQRKVTRHRNDRFWRGERVNYDEPPF